MESPKLPQKFCAVCARVLDVYEGEDGRNAYVHASDMYSEQPDHVVVPVDADEIHAEVHCDFCHALDPQWVLPVRAFEMSPGSGSDEGWATCSECKTMIERNQWNQIIRKALKVFEANNGRAPDPLIETSLRGMYRRLRENIAGSIRPIDA